MGLGRIALAALFQVAVQPVVGGSLQPSAVLGRLKLGLFIVAGQHCGLLTQIAIGTELLVIVLNFECLRKDQAQRHDCKKQRAAFGEGSASQHGRCCEVVAKWSSLLMLVPICQSLCRPPERGQFLTKTAVTEAQLDPNQTLRLTVSGRFGLEAHAAFRAAYQPYLGRVRKCEVCLRECTAIDSAGLAQLLILRDLTGLGPAQFSLVDCSNDVCRLLGYANFESLFTIIPRP